MYKIYVRAAEEQAFPFNLEKNFDLNNKEKRSFRKIEKIVDSINNMQQLRYTSMIIGP